MFLLNCSSGTNTQMDTDNGYIYKLEATQDVFIYDSSNYNAKHQGYIARIDWSYNFKVSF